MKLSVHTDGGSRGNPGHSGFGVVILADHQKVLESSVYLGVKTNNEAEYAGLLHALTWLRDHHHQYSPTEIHLYLDSELVVNQLNGQYRVKAAHLKPLYQQSLDLLSSLSCPVTITHVGRAGNSEADLLANQAMDRRYN
ncbi:ribonuclease HI family protein [Patescibacteria group bacterium]|nr:ribonuclease HI family protein [Patescibacteria group bacterium]